MIYIKFSLFVVEHMCIYGYITCVKPGFADQRMIADIYPAT